MLVAAASLAVLRDREDPAAIAAAACEWLPGGDAVSERDDAYARPDREGAPFVPSGAAARNVVLAAGDPGMVRDAIVLAAALGPRRRGGFGGR